MLEIEHHNRPSIVECEMTLNGFQRKLQNDEMELMPSIRLACSNASEVCRLTKEPPVVAMSSVMDCMDASLLPASIPGLAQQHRVAAANAEPATHAARPPVAVETLMPLHASADMLYHAAASAYHQHTRNPTHTLDRSPAALPTQFTQTKRLMQMVKFVYESKMCDMCPSYQEYLRSRSEEEKCLLKHLSITDPREPKLNVVSTALYHLLAIHPKYNNRTRMVFQFMTQCTSSFYDMNKAFKELRKKIHVEKRNKKEWMVAEAVASAAAEADAQSKTDFSYFHI
jgi:hypothetical protein